MYLFIINPVAGNGRAGKIYRRLKESQIYQQLHAVSYHTNYKGHAEELIEHLKTFYKKRDINAIVVIGGDGTIHEVLNGLKNWQVPVAFIPGGSGNDFSRGTGMMFSPEEILYSILNNQRTSEYWLGVYTPQQRKQRYFVNCIGVGFDALVAKRANRLFCKKWFNRLHAGSLVYLISLLYELLRYKPKKIIMEIDGESIGFERCFLLTVNNHPYFGGGMKINPSAKHHKDTFSVLVIDSISKWKVLALFCTVFTGKHLRFKEVHIFESKEIVVSSESPMPYQSDGETGTAQYVHVTKKTKSVKLLRNQIKSE